MSLSELIAKWSRGVAQIILLRKNERVGFGSAFLVQGGLVTTSRNIRSTGFDAAIIRFTDSTSENSLMLDSKSLCGLIAAESTENEKDFLFLKISGPQFAGRPLFEFTASSGIITGEHVLFLGYSFAAAQLTSHLGFVSSVFKNNGVELIQIDGSINSGFCGAPVIDLKSGKILAIINRAEPAFLTEQFNTLTGALRRNQIALERLRGLTLPGKDKIDPFESIRNSQAAMEQIVRHLRQFANVSSGFAISCAYVRDQLKQIS
jgi:hypothetical protein